MLSEIHQEIVGQIDTQTASQLVDRGFGEGKTSQASPLSRASRRQDAALFRRLYSTKSKQVVGEDAGTLEGILHMESQSKAATFTRRGFIGIAGAASAAAVLAACSTGGASGGSGKASGTLKFWNQPWGGTTFNPLDKTI